MRRPKPSEGGRNSPARREMTMRSNNTAALKALALTLLTAVPTTAHGQADWPARPVLIIVGYPAGSATDAAARVVTGALPRKIWGPIVVWEPGGGGGGMGGRGPTPRGTHGGTTG